MRSSIDYKILHELKKSSDHVSGEWLAAKFNITRQALWKHIGKLQSWGYDILAVPHLGYKLVGLPDKLYPWEVKDGLKSKVIGRDIDYHESMDSTQNKAWKLGLADACEGILVLSEKQSRGRGRLSRHWISSYGGIYFSLLLRPSFMDLSQAPQITFMVALGVFYGIKKATGMECAFKWPNDIFLNGRKLCGILCEANSDMDRINFVVAGVGVNVNTKDLPDKGTSLFLEKRKKINRILLLRAILEEIDKCYHRARREGFSFLLREWESLCFLWGRKIKVRIFERELEGIARGIDDQGCLLLELSPRKVERIYSGDVTKVN